MLCRVERDAERASISTTSTGNPIPSDGKRGRSWGEQRDESVVGCRCHSYDAFARNDSGRDDEEQASHAVAHRLRAMSPFWKTEHAD